MKAGRSLWILFFKRAGGWIGLHLRSGENPSKGEARPKELRPRQRGEARASGRGGRCEKLQPQASQRRGPARTAENDGQMKEAALLSLSSRSALLSVAGSTHSYCAATRVAALVAWEESGGQRESLSPLWVSKASCVTELCMDQHVVSSCRLFVIITLCVCEHGGEWNKASWDSYRNTGCFVECVCRW